MPYSKEISRTNPSCILFLLDQSGSMSDSVNGERKDQYLAKVFNRTLQDLILRCSKDEGVRNYFLVGAIGYGGSAAQNAFRTETVLVPISELADTPIRIDEVEKKLPDGAGGLVTTKSKFPVWYEPKAGGLTPMGAALRLAFDEIEKFCSEHPESFPPVIMNMTDGMSTDEDPEPVANALTDIETLDGKALLLNLHISDHSTESMAFPSNESDVGNDEYARTLFRMSSELPHNMQQAAKERGYPNATEGARGYIFNAQPENIVHFFEIGTRGADLR